MVVSATLLLTALLVISCNGCKNETQRIIEPNKKITIKLRRFDKALFSVDTTQLEQSLFHLYQSYGSFYTSYAHDVLRMPQDANDTLCVRTMRMLLKYKSMLEIQRAVDSTFENTSEIEADLSTAMSIYKQEFPDGYIPSFITFTSEFGYGTITYDSSICIGLDMYMNNRFASYYRAFEFPEFMIRKLRKEYIVPNCLKALAIRDYENQSTKDKRFIATMLVEGKVRYFAKALLPTLHDSVLMGYTAAQLEWSKQNEAQTWTHFIQKELLYKNEPSQFMRYFNDGPFTSADGVPPESSPMIGTWLGLQVIRAYMLQHPEVSLQQLMEETDFDKILKQSKYRPE